MIRSNLETWMAARPADSLVAKAAAITLLAATMVALLVAMPAATSHAEDENHNAFPAGASEALAKGTKFQLYSIDPSAEAAKGDETFHGYKILGRAEISDAKVRAGLVAALEKGVKAGGSPAMCFEPRHGIRVTQNGKVYDFVICFTCSQIGLYIDDKQQDTVLVSDSPRAEFDKVLKAEKLPLAK